MDVIGEFCEGSILPAKGLGAAAHAALTDGILCGCGMTYANGAVTIAPGHVVIGGRAIRIQSSSAVNLSAAGGWARITATFTPGAAEPVAFGAVYATGLDSFGALTQDEINIAGGSYTGWIATADIDGGAVYPRYACPPAARRLWTNPAPSAAFAAQTITLPEMAGYDALVVGSARNNDGFDESSGPYLSWAVCPIRTGLSWLANDGELAFTLDQSAVGTGLQVVVRQRNMYVNPSTGEVRFTTGYYARGAQTGEANPATLIPQAIYGMCFGGA